MQHQNQEILAIIILGALLALLLVGFIVAIVFLYQKRQQQHRLELISMQDEYDQQILRVQFEMQEATLAEISNKLHDALKNNIHGIADEIRGIKMKMVKQIISNSEVIEKLDEYYQDLIIVKDEIRLTSHSLSQDKLSKVGLIDTIKFEANRLQRNSTLQVSTKINENLIYDLTQEQCVYLFRMFQEIIGNVTAHSKATSLEIIVDAKSANLFLLSVKDNGVGFDINQQKKNKLSGIGLSGLQKRALQLGAAFNINSKIGEGTSITIELPTTISPALHSQENTKKIYTF